MSIEDYVAVALFWWLASCSTPAFSKTLAVAARAGVTIALTNERCQLEAVKNLPNRATWTEGGKAFEGCYGVSGSDIVAYFDDKTIAVIPIALFSASREI